MKKFLFVFGAMCIGLNVNAQELSLEEALKIALQNNHGIQVSKLQNEAAHKDIHPGKAGLLPSLDFVAGANYSDNTSDVTFAGNNPPLIGVEAVSSGYNAGVQLSYVLFDGLGTFRSYQKLKSQGEIADLQSKISIESTLLQLIANYFDVVRNEQLKNVYESMLAISKERLTKMESNFEYGAAAKIDVLNAKVDFNNDRSNLLTQLQNLKNAKRQLNYLLGRELTTDFKVQTSYQVNTPLSADSLKSKVLSNNSSLVLSQLNLSAAEIDKKIATSRFAPKVSMNLSYGYNQSEKQFIRLHRSIELIMEFIQRTE